MLINKLDNVEVNTENGHKYARFDIKKGDHVHSHNVKTNLSGNLEYTYNFNDYGIPKTESNLSFDGYVRENGDVGIRNE
ncbi:MAG: altronate dehydratase, partial [Acutalibacteraceae bacterium]|nr:altronate dehydratase [Acutalibacteraceae bacterium]